MFVYNITMKVNPSIEKEWVQWQREEHIPEILATGLFTEHKFYRLLDQDETDGITYIIQYFSSTQDQYRKYIEQFAPRFRKEASDKWKDQFVGFRTVMQVVQ
ncbi:MAG: DUF4286 family protein [Bacteroidetes bacterium]|nr:DUF4286 family protein [Bacteroidota bacterium]MBS1632358.1 DUF4286 family protein [Bacteroidota bacterium]